ncbi:hypothetical protein TNCV_3652691 [Trichonephila clavipes]|nr:hypothetical protein TNCV_3652691 [Trichonephila clavipes]
MHWDTLGLFLPLGYHMEYRAPSVVAPHSLRNTGLRDKNISIDFGFFRGHMDILGDERADGFAKAATKRKINITVNIPKPFYKKITKERMPQSWNQEYLISNKKGA